MAVTRMNFGEETKRLSWRERFKMEISWNLNVITLAGFVFIGGAFWATTNKDIGNLNSRVEAIEAVTADRAQYIGVLQEHGRRMERFEAELNAIRNNVQTEFNGVKTQLSSNAVYSARVDGQLQRLDERLRDLLEMLRGAIEQDRVGQVPIP